MTRPWGCPAASSSAPAPPRTLAIAGGAHGRAGLALDPIATQKIEELVFELKQDYTIIIVTNSMQQAAWRLRHDRLFYMGAWSRGCVTETLQLQPGNKQTEDYITGRFG